VCVCMYNYTQHTHAHKHHTHTSHPTPPTLLVVGRVILSRKSEVLLPAAPLPSRPTVRREIQSGDAKSANIPQPQPPPPPPDPHSFIASDIPFHNLSTLSCLCVCAHARDRENVNARESRVCVHARCTRISGVGCRS
jgi:hypothetical protein